MIQLHRLFGEKSKELKSNKRTDKQWKITLQKLLDELFKYTEENIHTDGLHLLMIYSGFASAHEALKEDDFWPGYTEGIIRVCFLLMGDYPDHKKYKGGRKKADHYSLCKYRDVIYNQSHEKKKNTLLSAGLIGFPDLKVNPRDAISKFRAECGYKAGAKDFMRWYKFNYPSDYAELF